MKRSTLLVFGSVACLLIGCGKMKQITDEQAKEIAKDIMAKQDDFQLFTEPNNFIYKSNNNSYNEQFSKSGKTQTNVKNETTFMIDVEKLASYRHTVIVQSSGEGLHSSESTITSFYDTTTAKLFTLYDENGYKYRNETNDITLKQAKNYFSSERDGYEERYKWRGSQQFSLNTFDNSLEEIKSLQEKFKDEEDQYCNYFLGSDDAKSLQVMVDAKQKAITLGYNGYSVSNLNLKIKNNLFDSITQSVKLDLTEETDKRFYMKSGGTTTTTITYGNAKIGIPSIDDYPLENN